MFCDIIIVYIKGGKMKKGFKVILLSLVMLAIAICINTTYAAVYNNFIYAIYNNEVRITGYEGNDTGDLIIPSEIEGLPVTEIGESAFDGCVHFNGTLTLPEGVTSPEIVSAE